MPYSVSFSLPRSTMSEYTIGAMGFTHLRWDATRTAYVARGTHRAISAMGQQPISVLPEGCCKSLGKTSWDHGNHPGSAVTKETLRRFARAAAIADGNAFCGSALERADSMESQYMNEAMTACQVLEGLGVDPDAFASMYPDPLSCFRKLGASPDHSPIIDEVQDDIFSG